MLKSGACGGPFERFIEKIFRWQAARLLSAKKKK
jgi:hypothetical protein